MDRQSSHFCCFSLPDYWSQASNYEASHNVWLSVLLCVLFLPLPPPPKQIFPYSALHINKFITVLKHEDTQINKYHKGINITSHKETHCIKKYVNWLLCLGCRNPLCMSGMKHHSPTHTSYMCQNIYAAFPDVILLHLLPVWYVRQIYSRSSRIVLLKSCMKLVLWLKVLIPRRN